ncbi:trypsin-like peptidase domain-containing protein [Flavobacterium sp. PS2]|uniref:trypsin-like peptidase domain-containing protein n=1 Tax=Flavobacterium sp. PS2 TaxID=3384157 RepID=UPI00390C8D37
MSQENKLSTSEQIINSTIRIECTGDTIINNQKLAFTSTGTGFFFEFLINNMKIPVIVTNYHVIKNTTYGVLNFTEKENNLPKYGSILTYTLNDWQNRWIKHPNVDLAILPLAPIIDDFKKQKNKDISYVHYDETLLSNANLLSEVTAIEEVLMVGYPKGFWDKVNNLPVVRKGTTATPMYIDYSGKKEFLLDIPIFAGSSGSPVVLFNQGSYSTKDGGINIGSRIALLGINVQSIDYIAGGQLILPPNNPTVETSTAVPMNIAVIIKSEELLAFKPIIQELLKKQK